MSIINVEVYSIVILLILITDYVIKFKKKFNTSSLLWLALSISTFFIAISNITFFTSNIYIIKFLSLIIYLLSITVSSSFVYMYVKYVYINSKINIQKEILVMLISILFFMCVVFIFVFFHDFQEVISSFDRNFINRLLVVTIIPTSTICLFYIYSAVKRYQDLDYKIIITLLITIVALIIDITHNELSSLAGAYTISCLIIYINKHEFLLSTDPLTGLLNRRSLDRFIENLKPNLSVAVYNFDVNDFKKINDTLGHSKGDIVLKDISKVLKKSFRDRDLVIRLGGDEFLILAIIREKDNADILLEKIKTNLEQYSKSNRLKPSLSIGWGIYKSSKKTSIEHFNKFLKTIDKKMYLEKEKFHNKK